jgi:hypothetical protein
MHYYRPLTQKEPARHTGRLLHQVQLYCYIALNPCQCLVLLPYLPLHCRLGATASFLLLPVRYTPAVFKCPWSPWLPSLGVLCCLHLIGSLG